MLNEGINDIIKEKTPKNNHKSNHSPNKSNHIPTSISFKRKSNESLDILKS